MVSNHAKVADHVSAAAQSPPPLYRLSLVCSYSLSWVARCLASAWPHAAYKNTWQTCMCVGACIVHYVVIMLQPHQTTSTYTGELAHSLLPLLAPYTPDHAMLCHACHACYLVDAAALANNPSVHESCLHDHSLADPMHCTTLTPLSQSPSGWAHSYIGRCVQSIRQ